MSEDRKVLNKANPKTSSQLTGIFLVTSCLLLATFG